MKMKRLLVADTEKKLYKGTFWSFRGVKGYRQSQNECRL